MVGEIKKKLDENTDGRRGGGDDDCSSNSRLDR
jgi:hypothetical protein